jgi:hypothetical protein
MGEEVKIIAVQAENDGTLIQVDFYVNGRGDRMFLPIRDVFKALNNYAYLKLDKTMLDMGFELEDPENYKNPNLID